MEFAKFPDKINVCFREHFFLGRGMASFRIQVPPNPPKKVGLETKTEVLIIL